MSNWESSGEPTHAIPPNLERWLIEGKKWIDRRAALKATIMVSTGSAQRNQEDMDEIDREAASILEEIVEAVEESWGFARSPKEVEA